MAWEKLPPIEGKMGGCLCCGVRPSVFPQDGLVAVGFGEAAVTKDGVPIWVEGDDVPGGEEFLTGAMAEQLASQDPDHDWRIVLYGPLSGREYQRQGPGAWMLIHQDKGFA